MNLRVPTTNCAHSVSVVGGVCTCWNIFFLFYVFVIHLEANPSLQIAENGVSHLFSLIIWWHVVKFTICDRQECVLIARLVSKLKGKLSENGQ